MMIRWPEIITASARLRRAVNGRRGCPPATHGALLLSCLMLLRSRLAVKSKAVPSWPQSCSEIAPKVHLVLKDGEGSEGSGLQQRCEVLRGQPLPSGLRRWPGLQSQRRPHSRD